MEDLIGKKIENYRIISVLGRGGMGIVYKAKDEKLDRFVAVKVLSVKAVNKERFIERFKREAKNHAQLLHPNIVTVYGFIEYHGLLGIVMEYVEGESLEKVIFRNSRLHIYDVVYIIRQVLVGIGYAHSKGFVHRDIKPSNIILNSEGSVKIMDFGISKSRVEKGDTKTGAKIGTVYYMSPEQIRGDDVDHLTDIYSIGCTIYEMITGKPPFFADSEYEIMDGHLKKEVARLSVVFPGIPEALDQIVFRTLRKNPTERYQNCDEILEKLHELDEYMQTVKSKYFLRTKKDPKKTRIKSTIAFSSVIIILAALVYFAFIQVGELLESDTLSTIKKYSIQSLFSDSPSEISFNRITTLNSGTSHTLNSIMFPEDGFGIAAGDSGSVLRTLDSAYTWEEISLESGEQIRDVFLLDDGRSFLVGDNSLLVKSSDMFSNYEYVSFNRGYNLYSIKLFSSGNGFITGSKGAILQTTDAGETWSQSYTSTDKTIYDLDFINPEEGFAVGWDGILLKTVDGGKSWQNQEKLTNKYLKSVEFYDNDLGIICGGASTVFRTVNGGKTWNEIKIPVNASLNDVKFVSEDIAIIAGAKGLILISIDKGITWKAVETKNFAGLNKMSVSSEGNVYLSGMNGTILKINLTQEE